MTRSDDKVVLVLHDDSSPVGDVAAWLRGCLDGWPASDVLLVGIVAGELYDNARLHGVPPFVIELVLDRVHDVLTVSVGNRAVSSTAAWRRQAGLLLVEALSRRWGVLVRGGTTTTWAEVVLAEE